MGKKRSSQPKGSVIPVGTGPIAWRASGRKGPIIREEPPELSKEQRAEVRRATEALERANKRKRVRAQRKKALARQPRNGPVTVYFVDPATGEALDEHSEVPNYRKYLRTSRWASIRVRAFAHHGRRCAACGSTKPGLHVHHMTYARLGREEMDDLRVFCERCHKTVHTLHRQKGSGSLRSVTLTYIRTVQLRPQRFSSKALIKAQ